MARTIGDVMRDSPFNCFFADDNSRRGVPEVTRYIGDASVSHSSAVEHPGTAGLRLGTGLNRKGTPDLPHRIFPSIGITDIKS